MMKRIFVFFLCFVFSVLVICGGMCGADYYRCTQLEKPLFAMGVPDTLYDDGGSGTYRGLGYEIEIMGHLSSEGSFEIETLDMTLLGLPVYSVIACY